ncbi:hypothetical protein AAVH_25517 [Aphelenchoides avenae]|nr:hypothetical protein AAVH_25517 [Aphelenchus avenae]
MFKTTNRGTKVVRTVAVVHSRGGDEAAPSADALIALGKPQRKDVQAPSSEFAKVIPSRHPPEETAYTESAAELFALTNKHLGKRLDVYKWAAEQRISDNSFPSIPEFPTTHFYDLYLLQIIDVQ